MVKALIAGGADVKVKKKDGWTALHLAARYQDVAMVKALLKGRAYPKAKTKDEYTALMLATYNKNEKERVAIARALLAGGADAVLGMKAAANNGPVELVKLLLEHQAKQNGKMWAAWVPHPTKEAKAKDPRIIKLLNQWRDKAGYNDGLMKRLWKAATD